MIAEQRMRNAVLELLARRQREPGWKTTEIVQELGLSSHGLLLVTLRKLERAGLIECQRPGGASFGPGYWRQRRSSSRGR